MFEKYNTEVKEKWGQTEAFREHKEKTKDYSKEKRNSLAEDMDNIMQQFSLCMKNGNTPDSIEAQNLVKLLQNHITENYYNCTDQILAGLGQMYVADERFKNNIDKHAEETAEFVSKAIAYKCGEKQ